VPSTESIGIVERDWRLVMRFDRRLLGWGLFFVLLGAVPLAVRAGLLSTDLVGRWPLLWPFLLIGWGLGLLLRARPGAWIGGLVTVLALGLMGGGAIAAGFGGVPAIGTCGSEGTGQPFGRQEGTFATTGRLAIAFDCGLLTVSPVDGSDWSVTGTDPGGMGPVVTRTGSSVELRGQDRGSDIFTARQGRTAWSVNVPRGTSLDLGVTLKAGQGTVDLSGTKLASLDLTVNAGALDVDLARAEVLPHSLNATVNAGSATIAMAALDGSASLSLNAGSLTACVPSTAAMRIVWSGALASNDFDSLGLVRVDDHTWTTAAFDANAPHLELHVSANAGHFGLSIGGACNA
jgi:hypothetical protein